MRTTQASSVFGPCSFPGCELLSFRLTTTRAWPCCACQEEDTRFMPDDPATLPPTLPTPRLCLGIDIGKARHTVGFVSTALLARHGSFAACPTTIVHLSRESVDQFLTGLARHVPLAECSVLLEHTGHYHRTL